MADLSRRRMSIQKAMNRATLSGPTIFTGEEALREVAKAGGVWNWALVGPQHELLPLSGGGPGGLQEMKGVLGHHPHSFGLLRMTFGTGESARTMFINVHASDAMDSGSFSLKTRSQTLAVGPAMENAIKKFAPGALKVRIHCQEECTLEYIVDKLKAVSHGADLVTAGVCTNAMKEYQGKCNLRLSASAPRKSARSSKSSKSSGVPEETPCLIAALPVQQQHSEDDDEEEEAPCLIAALPVQQQHSEDDDVEDADEEESFDLPPAACVGRLQQSVDQTMQRRVSQEETDSDLGSLPEVGPQLSSNADAPPAQRRKVRAFHPNDLVEIWSVKHDAWFTDGEVIDVVDEKCARDGLKLRAGSIKVLYMNGERFKWVPPQLADQHLRPSLVPKPPDVVTGKLLKETHATVTEWRVVHVEVHKGWIQWWGSKEDAVRGAGALGSAHLLGMQQLSQGAAFSVRAASTQGAVHTFKAPTAEEAAVWVNALWEHAGHCVEMEELQVKKRKSSRKNSLGGA